MDVVAAQRWAYPTADVSTVPVRPSWCQPRAGPGIDGQPGGQPVPGDVVLSAGGNAAADSPIYNMPDLSGRSMAAGAVGPVNFTPTDFQAVPQRFFAQSAQSERLPVYTDTESEGSDADQTPIYLHVAGSLPPPTWDVPTPGAGGNFVSVKEEVEVMMRDSMPIVDSALGAAGRGGDVTDTSSSATDGGSFNATLEGAPLRLSTSRAKTKQKQKQPVEGDDSMEFRLRNKCRSYAHAGAKDAATTAAAVSEGSTNSPGTQAKKTRLKGRARAAMARSASPPGTKTQQAKCKKEKARQFSRESRARKKEYIERLEQFVEQMKARDAAKSMQILRLKEKLAIFTDSALKRR